MIEINYAAVAVCGVLAMALGFVWYGPLFGKLWLRVTGADTLDLARREEMKKKAMPLYFAQLALVLVQIYVLVHYIQGWQEASGLENSLWIWLAFVMPTVAASAMWTADSAKVKWTKFVLQAGYHLVLFVSFGIILAAWK